MFVMWILLTVLWTEREISIERIERDPSLWKEMLCKSASFLRKAIRPELLEKFYSRQTTSLDAPHTTDTVYCYCGGPEDFDDMIGCDDEMCKLQWFHLKCLKMLRVPKGKWFCPECRKLAKNRKSKSKK